MQRLDKLISGGLSTSSEVSVSVPLCDGNRRLRDEDRLAEPLQSPQRHVEGVVDPV